MAEASGSGQAVIADGSAGLSASADRPGHAGPHTCASRLFGPGRLLDLAPSSGRHDVLPAIRGAVIARGCPGGPNER
jgi:hypothetical protein